MKGAALGCNAPSENIHTLKCKCSSTPLELSTNEMQQLFSLLSLSVNVNVLSVPIPSLLSQVPQLMRSRGAEALNQCLPLYRKILFFFSLKYFRCHHIVESCASTNTSLKEASTMSLFIVFSCLQVNFG